MSFVRFDSEVIDKQAFHLDVRGEAVNVARRIEARGLISEEIGILGLGFLAV